MIHTLPEELNGVISVEEWNRLKSGYKVRIGTWQVSYASSYKGIRAWSLSPDKKAFQILICSMRDILPSGLFDIRATYAALQLVVRAPDVLVEMFESCYGKTRTQGCLDLKLE